MAELGKRPDVLKGEAAHGVSLTERFVPHQGELARAPLAHAIITGNLGMSALDAKVNVARLSIAGSLIDGAVLPGLSITQGGEDI